MSYPKQNDKNETVDRVNRQTDVQTLVLLWTPSTFAKFCGDGGRGVGRHITTGM